MSDIVGIEAHGNAVRRSLKIDDIGAASEAVPCTIGEKGSGAEVSLVIIDDDLSRDGTCCAFDVVNGASQPEHWASISSSKAHRSAEPSSGMKEVTIDQQHCSSDDVECGNEVQATKKACEVECA